MKELIEKLQTWKDDIDCDIRAEWIEESKKMDSIRQSIAISQAIGILSTLGASNNIPQ